MGVPHKSWIQCFAIMAKEYKENLQTCLDTQTRGKMNRVTGSQMISATSATSLPEMPNIQHRTEHRRLDEQQVDDHGVNIVNYGDWAHEQGLNPPQREDPLSTMVARASEESGSNEDENGNDMEMGMLAGCTQCIHR